MLGLKNLAMLPSYFDYIFVQLWQKARLRPELSPKFLLTLGPNMARTRTEKPGPAYNSDSSYQSNISNLDCVIACFFATTLSSTIGHNFV